MTGARDKPYLCNKWSVTYIKPITFITNHVYIAKCLDIYQRGRPRRQHVAVTGPVTKSLARGRQRSKTGPGPECANPAAPAPKFTFCLAALKAPRRFFPQHELKNQLHSPETPLLPRDNPYSNARPFTCTCNTRLPKQGLLSRRRRAIAKNLGKKRHATKRKNARCCRIAAGCRGNGNLSGGVAAFERGYV